MAVRISNSTLFAFHLLFLSHQTFPQTNIQREQNVHSQFNPPVFEDITIQDGLPDNTVYYIFQDYLGYISIGTENGLVQYDGYSMKVFQPEENINSYKNGRGINTIYEDKNKTLWIGTSNGLYKFDRTNDSFKSYRHNPLDTNSLSHDRINRIYEDNNGKFWVGTGEGLNLFDRDNEIFTRYYLRDGDPKSRSTTEANQDNLNINTIIEDPASGDLLIGSDIEGLWKFSVTEKTFSKHKFNNENHYLYL